MDALAGTQVTLLGLFIGVVIGRLAFWLADRYL